MIVVDAVWEKRNLGVTCTEFKVESGDTIEAVKSALSESEQEYNVLKLPAGEPGLLFEIAELGYKFIETSINVTHDLKEVNLTGVQKRMLDSAEYTLMDESDVELLFSEIRKNIFVTDRIYIDPHFMPEQAANRYVGWITDEMQRGAEIFNLIYKNERIGFFTFKKISDGVYFPFLAGIYTDYAKWGMGMNLLYKTIVEARKRKAKMISTYISTNNKSVVNTHLALNYKFNEFSYVFVKHADICSLSI